MSAYDLAPLSKKEKLDKLCKRQNNRCFYCVVVMTEYNKKFKTRPTDRSVERLLPRSHGGRYSKNNTVAACVSCNNARPMISWQDYRKVRFGLIAMGWLPGTRPSKRIVRALQLEFGYFMERHHALGLSHKDLRPLGETGKRT